MEAALSDEEEPAIFEPGEHLACQSGHFVITEIHQQPVGEDDVILASGQLQFGDVGLQKLDVLVMAVTFTIAVDVALHEIYRRQTTCQRNQMIRKPPKHLVDPQYSLSLQFNTC